VTAAPAQAGLPDLSDLGVPSAPTATSAPAAVRTQANPASVGLKAAPPPPAPLTVDLQPLTTKVATSGQAVFRAVAASGSSVSNLTFEATLPANFSYNRTLGAAKSNGAIASTATTSGSVPTGQKVTWTFTGSDGTLDANGSHEIIFIANAPAVPVLSATTTMKASSGGGTPNGTESETISVTDTALTIEIEDSPFAVGDQNNVGTSIPRVATLAVRLVNPTLAPIATSVKIGNGTTAGTFPGATFTNPLAPTCSTISGGLGMLALENHGASGADVDATRAITVPARGLSNGLTTIYYPLCYKQLEKNVRRTFTVWTDAPGAAPANGALTIDSNISASANKINPPITGSRVGDVITMTVSFEPGTIGSIGSVWLQPAGAYGFDPLVARLRSLSATWPGVTTVPDRSYYVGLPGSTGPGSVTYTFDAIGFGTTSFAPYQFAASGANLKYTGNFGTSETILTPPNLSIAKKQRKNPVDATTPPFTDQAISVGPGDIIEYQLTVSNSGQQNATGVNVSDTVPTGTSYVAGSASSGGTLNGNTVEWTGKTVTANSSITLTFQVQIPLVVPVTFEVRNTASVTSDNGGHPTSNEVVANGAGVVDLTITKDCPSSVVLGETATYTIHYGNTGSSNATSVTVTDTLSAGQSYVLGSTTGGIGDPAISNGGLTLTFTIGTVSASASSSFSFDVAIATNAGTTVSDQASIAGNETDSDLSDNQTQPCSSVVTAPDLFVAKTCPTGPVLGEDASYTIDYGNNGDAGDSQVTLTDTLKANQTFVSASGAELNSTETAQNGDIIFHVADLPANSSTKSITVTVHVTATGTLANDVSISGHRAERSSTQADNSAHCDVAITFADLFVTKTCPTGALFGETASYSLTFGNAGTASAPGVVLTDVLSDGQSYNGDASIEPFSVISNGDGTTTIVWHLGELGAGAGGAITFSADVTGTGDISDAADIAGSRTEHDATENNNHAECGTNVTNVDLFITKTCPTDPVLGEDAVYTIGYGNEGTATATNVTVTDVLGAGQSYVPGSTTGTGEPSQDGPELTFHLGSVAPGGQSTQSFSFKVHVTSTGSLSNAAEIATGDQQDSDPSDNSAACAATVVYPDLTIAKECPALAAPGATVIHTLTYGNQGSADALDVVITDTLGGNQTFDDSDAPHTVDGQVVTFSVGTIPAHTTGLTIEYTVKIDQVSSAGDHDLTDSAVISGSRREVDATEGNNGTPACHTAVTYRPDLNIAKATSDDDVAPLNTITYTITVTNPAASSTAPATDTDVSDTLPGGTTFSSCGGGDSCGESGGIVTWDIGIVDVGETVVLTLTVTVGFDVGCQICNTASVSSPDDLDSPVVSDEVCIGTVPQGNPANAHSSGNAYGLDASVLGMHLDALGLPLSSVSSSQSGVGSDAPDPAVFAPVDVPDIATADVFKSTTGADVSGALRQAQNTSTAEVLGLNLLEGAITADVVRAVATTTETEAGASISASGSTIENLRINGDEIDDITPNKTVAINDSDGNPIGYAVLFEQKGGTTTPSGLKGGTYIGDLTVNMIHVFLGVAHPLGEGPGTEIVVAHANVTADFPQAELCSTPPVKTALASAFAARALIPDGEGNLVEIVKGLSGPTPSNGGAAHQDLGAFSTMIGSFGAVESDSQSTTDPVEADAFDQVNRLNLLGGAITATLLRAQVHSEASAAGALSNADGTKFVDLIVAETPISNEPAVDDRIVDLPGIGFVILNEQTPSAGPAGSSGITVTSIHIFVTLANTLGLPVGSEIWVSQARTDVQFSG
jgi:uncharacterized repeat protein (TIGR01451 family)